MFAILDDTYNIDKSQWLILLCGIICLLCFSRTWSAKKTMFVYHVSDFCIISSKIARIVKKKKRILQQYNIIRSWKTRSSVTSSFVKSTTALSLVYSASGRLSSCAASMSVHGFHVIHIKIGYYSIMLKITPLRSACRFQSISIFQTILLC